MVKAVTGAGGGTPTTVNLVLRRQRQEACGKFAAILVNRSSIKLPVLLQRETLFR